MFSERSIWNICDLRLRKWIPFKGIPCDLETVINFAYLQMACLPPQATALDCSMKRK